MPSLAGLRWNPTVTVLNPTSAMVEEKQPGAMEKTGDDSALKWLREKIHERKRPAKGDETSANTHT